MILLDLYLHKIYNLWKSNIFVKIWFDLKYIKWYFILAKINEMFHFTLSSVFFKVNRKYARGSWNNNKSYFQNGGYDWTENCETVGTFESIPDWIVCLNCHPAWSHEQIEDEIHDQ